MKWALLVLLLICSNLLWAANISDISERAIEQIERTGDYATRQRIYDWRALVDSHRKNSNEDKMRWVNDFINAIPYVEDTLHWGREDYWAAPYEVLEANGGDCEDLAIAKYFMLRAMGVSDQHLRIVYVKTADRQPHMVLFFNDEDNKKNWVLDNLKPYITTIEKRTDLVLIYSFNADSLWLPQADGSSLLVGGASRVSRWSELRSRMHQNN